MKSVEMDCRGEEMRGLRREGLGWVGVVEEGRGGVVWWRRGGCSQRYDVESA